MFSSASLHPVATFAILAATFSYLYAQHRQLHFLLWGLGWAALAVRETLVAALAPAPPWFILDIAAGILILLGGIVYSGRSRSGLRVAAILGLALLFAAIVVTALALLDADGEPYRAAGVGILATSWIGTGWLVRAYGRTTAPAGARLAGLALAAWGIWLPVEAVIRARQSLPAWLSEVDAGLVAIVVVGMIILAVEEARARGTRADSRQLLDEDPNMVAILQGRRIVYANGAFLDRMGWSLEAFQRIDTLDLVAPEFRDEAALRRQLREQGEAIADYEIELLDARGGRVAVIVHVDVIDWEGEPAHRYELIDMTDRRRVEAEIRRINAELRRMNAELELANQHQSEFLSNTTHELKTPLTSIMANTEILEYEMCGPVNDEQRRILANISRNSQLLLEMISRLLDFARQRAGASSLRVEEIHAREIIQDVAETVRPLLEEKGLRLEIDIDSDADGCWLDGEKIYRVYLNLVENAIKFSTSGTIRIGAAVSNGVFEGSVTDQGIGIPPEHLEDIFHAFTQVDASATRSYPGVGLGLAICRQLIEVHGGRIWVESMLGQGSAFQFRVPCMPGILPIREGSATTAENPAS